MNIETIFIPLFTVFGTTTALIIANRFTKDKVVIDGKYLLRMLVVLIVMILAMFLLEMYDR